MGIGDLLRSTAAWRSLKIKWPDAKLHLLFLSKHPGYSSEKFISKISLLSSATFLTISNDNSNDKKTRIKTSFSSLVKQIEEHCGRINPDLVIDFESSGIRTSIFTKIASRLAKANSIGINQFRPPEKPYKLCTVLRLLTVNLIICNPALKKVGSFYR
jgi:ADP-heptose:LPS heptosyltransferase